MYYKNENDTTITKQNRTRTAGKKRLKKKSVCNRWEYKGSEETTTNHYMAIKWKSSYKDTTSQ